MRSKCVKPGSDEAATDDPGGEKPPGEAIPHRDPPIQPKASENRPKTTAWSPGVNNAG